MASVWPAKNNYATGDVLTAANMNGVGDDLNDVYNFSGYAAGKNKLINGDFFYNQRAFTSVTTNNTYGFDRWALAASDGTVTYTPQTFTLGAAPVAGYEAVNYAQVDVTGQTLTSALANLFQKIEDVRTFAGQTVTLSFWAKATSGTPKVAVNLVQNFGTGGSPSTSVQNSSATQTISTSWARYSFTIALPSITGKTLGTTANTSFLGAQIWFSSGTASTNPGSIGIQTGTFQIWGVQLEAGSTASIFQTATGTKQGELALCQRYYVRWTGQAAAANDLCTGWCNSTTSAVGILSFPVTMRIAPTAQRSADADFGFTWSAGTSTISGVNIDRTSPNSCYLRLTTTGLTTGQGGELHILTGTTKWLEMSSEL